MQASLQKLTYYFTSWDVKNFYWSLKSAAFRFATQGPKGELLIWQMKSIPFGWDKACYIGQAIHEQLVSKVPHPPNTVHRIYIIDDGLAMGQDPAQLNAYTASVTEYLQAEGFPIFREKQPDS